ncbi:MAG: CHASE2 domain-containing protein [Leptolyngbyaceae bacterium]|nr:CHASE2 domain-containing protein [Leptolyngbyaceae bacterium]
METTVLHGRYQIIRVLGAGGFGQTYLANDTQRPEISPCVVKQFKPASQDPKFLQVARRLFNTEVDVLQRLGQHDQIPTFYDSFEENFEFYFVQEFVDGTALCDELDQIRQMAEEQVIELLRDVLGILEFVHSQRVIHRDVKPENLIRRKSDGKFVLIDFGAVKEIQTQIVSTNEQTKLTVGIGTEGYTPSEQLGGKPRYCSDIYALGVTSIQALTGLQPYQMQEDLATGEIIWRDRASVSIGFSLILDRMVRFHFSNRYQSADEVLQALDKLSNLPTDMTSIPESQLYDTLGIEDPSHQRPGVSPRDILKQRVIRGAKAVAIATVAVSGTVLGIRQLGWLQRFELVAYDRIVQLSPGEPTDSRLLVVGITEDNLRELQRPTPSDESLATVIQNLQQYNPRVIGIDLYRELPQDPGRDAFLEAIDAPNIIAITKLEDRGDRGIDAPPGVPPEQIGFNDFPIDADGVLRRNLLFGRASDNTPYHSFALQVARTYLAPFEIYLQNNPDNPQELQLGEVPMPRLIPHAGGYQREDTEGYQILLDYRAENNAVPVLSFVDILNGNFEPDLVEDRAILIGTVAPSSRDFFPTPYSAGRSEDVEMSGVMIHAQMVSHLLDIAFEERSLIWFLPEWGEIAYIILCSIAGGTVALFVRHPIPLAISGISLVLAISGTAFFMFAQQAWIPVVAPAIATLLSGGAVMTYRAYTAQQEHDAVTQFLKQNSAETLFTGQKPRKQ